MWDATFAKMYLKSKLIPQAYDPLTLMSDQDRISLYNISIKQKSYENIEKYQLVD